MSLSPEQLKKFIELYSIEYGVVLSEEKALEEFSKLAQLYKLTYQK